VKYRIHGVPDLPEDPMLRVVGQLFPLWPRWSLEAEEDLQLSDNGGLYRLRPSLFGLFHGSDTYYHMMEGNNTLLIELMCYYIFLVEFKLFHKYTHRV
jgi:hypothetical protein